VCLIDLRSFVWALVFLALLLESSPDRIDTRPRAQPPRSSRPRADQSCVYNTSTQNAENRIAAFIVE
jgi:hypothetical protein